LYKGFYKLKEDPFRLTPDPAFLYMTAQHREAFSGLVYSVCTRPGLTVLVGEAGTGKTTLLYTLAGLLEKRRFITALCTNPTLTREEFYDLLLIKFGVQCSSPLKSRQIVALQETLLRNRAEGRPSILIVDEAQRLSPEILEEIRLLLNIETAREKLLEIIVAGQPELTQIFRRPELRQLKQRVSCICKLEALNLADLREYMGFRLTRAGLDEQPLFPASTIEAVYEYTKGIPRLVNTLCDAALRIGFALQSPVITIAIVREAAKDLELEPSVPLDHLALNGADRAIASSVDAHVEPVVHTIVGDFNADGNAAARVPLADYDGRPREQGFLAGLMDRWR
jgi:general secretion pathway protein A